METILLVTITAFFLTAGISGIYLAAKIFNAFKNWKGKAITIIMMVMSIACILTAAAFAGLLS